MQDESLPRYRKTALKKIACDRESYVVTDILGRQLPLKCIFTDRMVVHHSHWLLDLDGVERGLAYTVHLEDGKSVSVLAVENHPPCLISEWSGVIL